MSEHAENLYGLIGYPLSHSFSRRYFTKKFLMEGLGSHAYHLFPLESIEELPDLIATYPSLRGLNVTIPYKEKVQPYLHAVEEEARAVGAVNTIRIHNGRLSGHNSDVFGFTRSLRNFLTQAGRKPKELRALVLGTGGAAKAVCYALRRMNIPFGRVSRDAERGELTYDSLTPKSLGYYDLIINTTPLGMSPEVDSMPPLPYEGLDSDHLLFDLVYNPEETAFLREGKTRGCQIINGLEMLYLQAERSWSIWSGAPSGND